MTKGKCKSLDNLQGITISSTINSARKRLPVAMEQNKDKVPYKASNYFCKCFSENGTPISIDAGNDITLLLPKKLTKKQIVARFMLHDCLKTYMLK